jgi:two-component system, sensor histidine kinase YesM
MIGKQLSTTRKQMFLGYISVMFLILVIMIGIAYYYVSLLLKDNASKYVDEIAGQVSGRVEALFNQIDTLTLQMMMNAKLQNILYSSKYDLPVSFDEQLSMRPILNDAVKLSDLVTSVDLYSLKESIYPADHLLLSNRLDPHWIKEADRNSGHLVWIGPDPQKVDSIIGIRQVRLENDHYSNGGYLIISAKYALLDFLDANIAKIEGSAMFLINQNNEIVSMHREANFYVQIHDLLTSQDELQMKGIKYRVIRKVAKPMNWTIVMLIPLNRITEGIFVLQKVLVLSSLIGLCFFTVASFALSTLITNPLRQLMRIMRRDTKEGDFKRNIVIYRNKEINELNLTYNRMVININQLLEEANKQELIKLRMEIKALQSQINPHFLYNTLEAFYWSLIEKEEKKLADQVIILANLFRYTIKKENEEDFVTLSQEIEHVKSYLGIMGLRMGNRLKWQMDIEESVLNIKVPKLLIQPIVENAILHGIEPKIGDGCIQLHVFLKDHKDTLCIQVIDNGVGMNEENVNHLNDSLRRGVQIEGKRSGIGLYNLNKFIQLYYGEFYGLSICSEINKGCTVEIILQTKRGMNK